MSKPVDRFEVAATANPDEVGNAGADEASELSKDDLNGVNGGVVSIPKNPPPFVTPDAY